MVPSLRRGGMALVCLSALTGCFSADQLATIPADGGEADVPSADAGAKADTGRADVGAAMDATVGDAGSPGDVGGGGDAGGTGDVGVVNDGSSVTDAPPVMCGDVERCGNGVDDDCDGTVDEGCVCIPGETLRCWGGRPELAGRGACTFGTMTCTGSGEFGSWGACEGAGGPSVESCGNERDDDCDGTVDEGCGCRPGDTRTCYTGPMGTAGVGRCRAGLQECVMTASGADWGTCGGEVLPGVDRCDGDDLDCDGVANTGCTCRVGETRECYTGPTGTAGVGPCRAGTQTCARGSDGAVTWGTCEGQTLPGTDACDGVDLDCDGAANTGCACALGDTRSCYDGPEGTAGVGRCRAGMQSCVRGASGVGWASCSGTVLPVEEVCNNGVDEDCDGMVDEGCRPCIAASGSPWQMHRATGPVCFGRTFSVHGDPGEYALATIPGEGDGGWAAVSAGTIDFSESSALCGRTCTCLDGGEFTFFQTFFTVPDTYRVTSLRVTVGSVDDGVRVTVFNDRYPGGVVDPGSYAYLGGGSTTDLAGYITTGRNRVVLTHIDDCCSARSITGVRVEVNGGFLDTCTR